MNGLIKSHFMVIPKVSRCSCRKSRFRVCHEMTSSIPFAFYDYGHAFTLSMHSELLRYLIYLLKCCTLKSLEILNKNALKSKSIQYVYFQTTIKLLSWHKGKQLIHQFKKAFHLEFEGLLSIQAEKRVTKDSYLYDIL